MLKTSLSLIAFICSCTAVAQQPLAYDIHYTATPIVIDGQVNDAAWSKAPWSSDFIDITADAAKAPVYRTRFKMLWDDRFLYIAAELQEPNVHGTLTEHDSVIFHDDDFEFFVKPVTNDEPYYEFEMNALNTTWDLYLNKPYRFGGKADNSWEATGLKSAVHVNGTLNKADDTDKGWTLEIALPLDAFASRQSVPKPVDGTEWRMNFSRVEYLEGHPREENWVWTPQGVINMHVPEHWGFVRFRKDTDEPVFHPPRAILRPLQPVRVKVSSGVMSGLLITHTDPDFCGIRAEAMKRGEFIGGTVTVHAVVGRDGTVLAVDAISGPELLRQTMIDAVKTWRYRPYLLNGAPVEVDTQITVSESCGG